MHPGPMNRGVEISPEIADGPYSVILEQVTNGVAVRMALLYLLSEATMTMLLRGGRVIDPSQKIDDVLDVLIEGGKIAAMGATSSRTARERRRIRA